MKEQITGEFTVSDLIRGWDDVRLLLTTTDADQVWAVVSSWPPQRLATAVVAAVTVLRTDDPVAAEQQTGGADIAVGGRRSPVSDGGRLTGHVSAAEWPG